MLHEDIAYALAEGDPEGDPEGDIGPRVLTEPLNLDTSED